MENGEIILVRYYLDIEGQSNGDHEVHRYDCSIILQPENRVDLGDYASCHPAVEKAKSILERANGCLYCCTKCHSKFD